MKLLPILIRQLKCKLIKDADKIVVLDSGLIKGEGTHEELYQNCPIYKDMYDSQYEMLKHLKHS